ncbi:glycosyltransferase [Modestobacter sp. SYSU DS0657]
MSRLPTLTVVIVTYNSESVVGDLLDELVGEDVETIVVDNASNDATVSLLEEYPSVRLIRNDRNVGFAAAVNRGIQERAREDVLLLNPDVRLPDSGLTALRQRAAQWSGDRIVAPRLVNLDGSMQESARRFPSLASHVRRRVGRWSSTRRDRSRIDSRPDWAIGAVLYVSGNYLRLLGPMDERFFLYCEDVDWGVRSWRVGSGVTVLSDVTFRHAHVRASRRGFDLNNPATRHHWASMCKLYLKYPTLALGASVNRSSSVV